MVNISPAKGREMEGEGMEGGGRKEESEHV